MPEEEIPVISSEAEIESIGTKEISKYSAMNIVINNTETYETAVTILKEMKKTHDKIESKRKELKAPIILAGKVIDANFKKYTDELAQIGRQIRFKCTAWDEEQEGIRQRQQQKLDEQARKEREAAEKKARDLELKASKQEAEGKAALAERNRQKAQAEQEKAETVVAPIVEKESPKPKGVSYRDKWTGNVFNLYLFFEHCYNTKNLGLFNLDQGALNKVIQASKGGMNFPGVENKREKIMAQRTG